jgi:lysophospholipase L1-like esterase
MKRIKLLLLLPVLMMVLLFSAMNYKPKKVILFGDSITEFGLRPGGYVDLLKKDLDPAKYEIIGSGIGGNKVYDLYLRMEEDVLNKKPDLVLIYIGVNDVWHKQQHKTGTDYPKFIKFYQALINKIQAAGAKVVLCTPAVIGEKKNGGNEQDAELDKYSGAIRELAAKNKLPIADLRKLFTTYEQEHNPDNLEKGVLTTDGVHLNDKGNRTLADTLLPFIK